MPVTKLKTKALDCDVVAKEWMSLKVRAREIENRKKDLKPWLEEFLKKQPGKKAEVAGFLFELKERSKDLFDLKGAQKNIDGRTLAPYLSKNSYYEIRTTPLDPNDPSDAA